MTIDAETFIVRGRFAARLAAVQALYQLEQEPSDPIRVVQQFILHRFNKIIDNVSLRKPDAMLFQTIVVETHERLAEIDTLVMSVLAEGWPLNRIDSVLRAILRAATAELLGVTEVPPPVVINEYINLTKEYFGTKEVAFVNASLDKLQKTISITSE